ncbi:TetR/AcrR family transcriptional regulator [soil metagenome]
MNQVLDRRQQILATAGDLFREHGYHATSIRDIAKSLDMRGSSLYAHVDSKEQMLLEIVTEAAGAFLQGAEGVDKELAPAERLRALVRGHLAVIVDELPNATVFFHEWRFLSGDLKASIILRRDAYEQHFRNTIRQGVEQGVFEVDDVKTATLFVLSALNWSYQWFSSEGMLSVDELTEKYTALIFNALKLKEVQP